MSKQSQHPKHLTSRPSTESLKNGAVRQSALQPKAAGHHPPLAAQGTRRTPVAPPAYRPQPVPKVLQKKTTQHERAALKHETGARPSPSQSSHSPRSHALQSKTAGGSHSARPTAVATGSSVHKQSAHTVNPPQRVPKAVQMKQAGTGTAAPARPAGHAHSSTRPAPGGGSKMKPASAAVQRSTGNRPQPGVIQPTLFGGVVGAWTGTLLGLVTAGPVGMVGGFVGGAMLGHYGAELHNMPANGGGAGAQGVGAQGGHGGGAHGAHGAHGGGAQVAEDDDEQDVDVQGGGAAAGAGVRRVRRRRARRPARVYNIGEVIGTDEYAAVNKALRAENRVSAAAYQAAVTATRNYSRARVAYDHDRRADQIPNNAGGTVSLDIEGGRVQAYGNNQNYFPAAGAPYTETDINPGVLTAGNYRLITPNAPVGNYTHWVGFNITHGGGRWIRVWNHVLGYWRNWNEATRTDADLAGHVGGAEPVDTRTPAERRLAATGYTRKILARHGGFQYVVREEHAP